MWYVICVMFGAMLGIAISALCHMAREDDLPPGCEGACNRGRACTCVMKP